MSNISKRRREGSRSKIKGVGDHKEFLKRITKTLYYGQLPTLPCLSLPVTEISCETWSASQRGRSLRRLHADWSADMARAACVSPCALVLALLYLERLNKHNPNYVASAAPSELFLVSLMVGNKFLQDDGEDDEVFCSEWAASGGMELKQLKKLEIEFLNAIDWNIFVSDESFEAGLAWLEKQVALKQAQLRGFFTYTDLAASCGDAGLTEALQAAARACLTVCLAYSSGLATLLASALVVSHAWLPALHLVTRAPAHGDLQTHNYQTDLYNNNVTLDQPINRLLEDRTETNPQLTCCTKWTQYREIESFERHWYDTVTLQEWKFGQLWSTVSAFNWPYQSSLVNPIQRWLEKMNEYADFIKKQVLYVEPDRYFCKQSQPVVHRRCVRQWLNFSKISSLVASSSDR